ncbi:deoxynucleoside kinase [Vaginisenegalia massiliensis]|uniref:deoxynucleoside kinase n=1 Tax=Vaginisenegalia massiliensis TaxID=2058294 RepID=UPI000F54A16A|nr:deoxynucleoside kinase [Vaginisenegalia massiliensis]
MSVIVVGGMIGAGKTSIAELLSKNLGSQVFYEDVENNALLPLYYQASEEEQLAKRYPFLLQLSFLNSRFSSIKAALKDQNNVLDRSIYEDWYFCKLNHQMGRISDIEFQIYEDLLDNMMEELDSLPKKAPDFVVDPKS